MTLKKLLFYNKSKKKNSNILLAGNSIFLDLLSGMFKHSGINFNFLKIDYPDKINFFTPIYLPETFLSDINAETDFSNIKFTFINKNIIFPVINNLNFFKETYLAFSNNKNDIKKFDKFFNRGSMANVPISKFLLKNFSPFFSDLIFAILKFYNYPEYEHVYTKKLRNILQNFFSKNAKFVSTYDTRKTFESLPSKNFKKCNSSVILNGNPHIYNILFTDINELIEGKITFEEKLVEFHIKKDYTTEYFPENIIFKSNGKFSKIRCNEKNEYKIFTIIGDIDYKKFFIFLKNYFPMLIEEDLESYKMVKKNYLNFKYEKEIFPFNLFEKLQYIKKEVMKNV